MGYRFRIHDWELSLSGQYLDRQYPNGIDNKVGPESYERVARLWVTEGIPFCFGDYPIVFEHLREYLASRLDVDPKEVSISGSGRVGFSLSPRHPGREYRPGKSDLDLFVVSSTLFEQLVDEYVEGERLWRDGQLMPSWRQEKDWNKNSISVERHMKRQFMQTNMVIRKRGQYTPQRTLFCENTLKRLNERLSNLRVGTWGTAKSLRAYKHWDAAVAQNALSVQQYAT